MPRQLRQTEEAAHGDPDQTEGNFQYGADEIVDPGPKVFSMAVEVDE